MATKDKRPKIELSESDTDKLRNKLDEMIEEAESFREKSKWDDQHANYWRMYRADPITETRDWPWTNASNLYLPLAKVAVNATCAHEYEAMLSNEPMVVGTEGQDQELSNDLSAYYFDYFYKKVLPYRIWGSDWLLDNAVDGTSAIKVRQNTDFVVRRSEIMEEIPIFANIGADEGSVQPVVNGFDYEWREEAIIERVNETMGDVCDLGRIYMAPNTGAGICGGGALYSESCPWYYQESFPTWEEMLMKKKALGFDFDDTMKAHLGTRDVTEKERAQADQTATTPDADKGVIRHLEFYMRWALPMKYRKYDENAEKQSEDITQKNDEKEDGFLEEIVVNYIPDARKIMLIRPLSRVCPDGKRPHVTLHYRRTPRYFYGSGQCSDLRDLQAGANKSWNQMYDYGDLSNMPWGFYAPGATGLLPEIGALEPGRMYEVMDPHGIYFHKFSMDPNFYMMTNQSIQQWAEKVSNVTDSFIGKAPTTPNAPRTARGQLAMLQMSNVQFAILTGLHAESFIEFFRRVHAFKRRWAPAKQTFRVMNKQTGMFQMREISDRAFQYDADFDFQMNPNRTQNQQISQALFDITISAIQQAIQSPMLADMIRSMTRDVYRDLGRKNFDQLWPEGMVQNIVMQSRQNIVNNQPPPQAQPGQPASAGPPMAPPMGQAEPNLSMTVQGI